MPAICPVQAPTYTSCDLERDLAMWMWLVEVYTALDIQACRCELPHGTIQLLGGKASRCHCMEEVNPWNLAYWGSRRQFFLLYSGAWHYFETPGMVVNVEICGMNKTYLGWR